MLGVEIFRLIVKRGIEGEAVVYMVLDYFILGAALRSDITQIIQCIMQREEAKYKKLKCYVLPENLSEKYFADLLSR